MVKSGKKYERNPLSGGCDTSTSGTGGPLDPGPATRGNARYGMFDPICTHQFRSRATFYSFASHNGEETSATSAMSTTLPLFWNLSSNSKKERIDASVKLVSALEKFQADFEPQEPPDSTSEDEVDVPPHEHSKVDDLGALNAQDVSYSIRRLVRGLGSPRESSRLGFAVALTEVWAIPLGPTVISLTHLSSYSPG